MRRRTILIGAVLALLVPWTAGAAEGEACGTCHPDVKGEYGDSIHAREFGCTGCHGGDPAAISEEAHAVDKGYIGRPQRAAVPALCASCHADPNRMKAYGRATDQFAQYQTSGHGRRLAQGDTRVAVCTDCHGTHHVLRTQEPTSPVAARNIVTTCGSCHNDASLMAVYKLPADQGGKFLASVHGTALLDDEHPAAPSCATCHGAHGAIAPHVGTINAVCGHCHQRTREYFNQGPHRKAADDGKMSECVSCHGYHDIAPPGRALFDTACPTCHAPDSTAFPTVQKLKTLLVQAEEAVETASAEMARVDEVHPTVVRHRPSLERARANFLEALPVHHSLEVERVEDLTRTARSIAEEVQVAVHSFEQEGQVRYIVLLLVWLFVPFAVGVAYLYRRERRGEHG